MKTTNITRRLLLIQGFVVGLTLSFQVLSNEEPERASSAGFYRTLLGQFEITALSDGTVDLPMDKLLHQESNKTQAQLTQVFLSSPTETSVNGYLVNTGDELVLVDTGAGKLYGPTLGKLITSLQAAGYESSDVDHILITHLHADHVGGLARDGKRVFPNATIHADKRDLDFWLSEIEMNKAPDAQKGFFQGAMASLNPYVLDNKVDGFDGSQQIVPGISTDATYGHTPGHTSYHMQSNGQEMWIIGDLIHAPAVQFPHPDITIDFDSNPEEAQKQRSRIFQQVANSKALMAGAHLQFPGLGHVRKVETGFEWIPTNYQRLR